MIRIRDKFPASIHCVCGFIFLTSCMAPCFIQEYSGRAAWYLGLCEATVIDCLNNLAQMLTLAGILHAFGSVLLWITNDLDAPSGKEPPGVAHNLPTTSRRARYPPGPSRQT